MSTTTSTLAGLMETINLAVVSNMPNYSSLWQAPYFAEANNALYVDFPVVGGGIRTASATAATEGANAEITAITLSANTTTLASYPVVALVSKSAMKGGSNVTASVATSVAKKVANTVDSLIWTAGQSFTTSLTSSDGFSLGDLTSAVGSLRAAGFYGPFVCVADWQAINGTYGLDNDILSKYSPAANDELIRGSGFLGMINGVEIYGTHMATGSRYAGVGALSGGTYGFAQIYSKDAVGFGYGAPLTELEVQGALEKNGAYVGGNTFCAAAVLDPDGGTKLAVRVS